MGCRRAALAAVLAVAALAPAQLRAADPDRALLDRVSARLLDVAGPLPALDDPSEFRIADNGLLLSTIISTERGRTHAVVTVGRPFFEKIVRGDPDVLAFALGHQIARLIHKHPLPTGPAEPAAKWMPPGAKEEADAEWTAGELVVRAGFSLRRGLRGVGRLRETDPAVNSFDGLAAKLPQWEKRMERFDREQLPLARLMSAWECGQVFLAAEQFVPAEVCLEQVTREFPACVDAWAGLGYARLMLYLDRLTPEEVADYRVDAVVSRGFRRRPAPFQPPVAGKNPRLWFDAAEALHEALRQSPGHARARAALGLAHLFHPRDGKPTEAAELLAAALAAAQADPAVSSRERGEILLNHAAALRVAGRAKEARAALGELRRLFAAGPMPADVGDALIFHEASFAAESDEPRPAARAAALFAEYLLRADPRSAWWDVAYARYARLCRDANVVPESRERLWKQAVAANPVARARVEPDAGVVPGRATAAALRGFGPVRAIVAARGTDVVRLVRDRCGAELLAADVVFAVRLLGAGAPDAVIDASCGEVRLRIGLAAVELDRLAGVHYHDWTYLDAGTSLRFYPAAGLAVRVVNGRVAEFVVVPVLEV